MRLTGAFIFIAFTTLTARAEPHTSDPGHQFLDFVRQQAAALRGAAKPPATLAEWKKQNAALRENLLRAWGGFPKTPCALSPRKLGELKRDGYRVEKIIFQTLPGVWMTANAYVPDAREADHPVRHPTAGQTRLSASRRLPAILCVHGHWRGAKQDPVVQARCIGPARLGFFVLAVDAFGAGERGIGKALGEYHGEMTAATLLPPGRPLSGLQVYENMRALDYLRSRPEVDPDRIGITGASGGGNQTMYAGAWDERFKAAVPVCSVGNYQAYLGVACCLCEVVPGALQFTEEGGVLGLTAPRGLMVVNATQDGIQFSVGEAKKSLAIARPVFELYGKGDHLKHAVFDWRHDYSQPMREMMYGWMTRHLKGEGDGSPIPDPPIKTEDPETLRCFPGESRPDDWVTIPKFAAAEARKLLAAKPPPTSAQSWRAQAQRLREGLVRVFGGAQPPTSAEMPEPPCIGSCSSAPSAKLALLLDLDGAEKAAASDMAAELRRAGWSVVAPELRATGKRAWSRDKVGRAPDHNTAEWALWLGRPLLGQWVVDVRRLLDSMKARDATVIGMGPAGVVALCAAALDTRITRVAAVGTLASYVSEEPYQNQRLGIMAPGILREVGDMAHVAALAAPRRVVIAGGVSGGGKTLTAAELKTIYQPAASVWRLLKAADELALLDSADAAETVRVLSRVSYTFTPGP
jgi:hypothetical protein